MNGVSFDPSCDYNGDMEDATEGIVWQEDSFLITIRSLSLNISLK